MKNHFATDTLPRHSGFFATPDTAREAVRMAQPFIDAAMQHKHVGESGFLYIVVMDPLCSPLRDAFESAILYEHAVGDRDKWDADYAGFARAKARVHWRTGFDSQTVQTARPHLLQPGDTTLWGSAAVDGIVVGVSGCNPWWDEAIAGTVAHCFKALARGAAAAREGELFLPGGEH